MAAGMETEDSMDAQLPASSCNLARRSVSIFSRRGTDSPTPTTQALAMSSLNMAFAASNSSLSPTSGSESGASTLPKAKNKRWSLTGRMERQISEGTILRAVPKDTPKSVMTPLEREMATSPNDEILRNIGLLAPESAPVTPIGTCSPLADLSNTGPPRRYYSKREKKAKHEVLGMWRDGKVQWDNKENETNLVVHARPQTADGSRSPKTPRPKIQVVIPDNASSRRSFQFMPFFGNIEKTTALPIHLGVSPPTGLSGASLSEHVQSSVVSPPTAYKATPQRPYQPITINIDESPAFEGVFSHETPRSHSRSESGHSSNSESESEETLSVSRSTRSSMTSMSVHNDENVRIKDLGVHSRRGSAASVNSFDKNDDTAIVGKAIGASLSSELAHPDTSAAKEAPRMADMIGLMRTPSTERPQDRKKRTSSRRSHQILAQINQDEELQLVQEDMPTLDEAVRNLEVSLLTFQHDSDGADAPEVVVEVVQSSVPEIMVSPSGAPPPMPRKSSKRKSRISAPAASRTSPIFAAMEARQTMLSQRRHSLQNYHKRPIPALRRRSSVRTVLSLVFEEDELQPIDPQAAEQVVYQILFRLDSLDDLFRSATVTRGFRQVFKANELTLLRQVVRNQCPPAWELRETLRPTSSEEDDYYGARPAPDYTPSNYLLGYKFEREIIAVLRSLIMEHCQSELRAETLTALQNNMSRRTDAALYRIWTFCQIFGFNKGREDDLVAQMDWLRGGILAHQDSCTSTISTQDSFYISGVLLSAPEHFAQGNSGGLSAEELYDMLEMWQCLNKLTSKFLGQTQLAKQFGVFDETEIAGGDIDGEEVLLEEWHAFISSLGLSHILTLASVLAADGVHAAFATAQHKGYMRWQAPPPCTTRTNFLHEAISRLYEERICETFSPEQLQMQEMRSIRRARDEEFRSRRLSTRSVSGPASMGQRTPASMSSSSSHFTPSLRLSATSSPKMPARNAPSTPPTRTAPSIPRRKTLPASSYAPRSSYFSQSESISEELPPYHHEREHSIQGPPSSSSFSSSSSSTSSSSSSAAASSSYSALRGFTNPQNSGQEAVQRIIEMGFSADDAKGALKITDMGDGLRVDRAVEYLLRTTGRGY